MNKILFIVLVSLMSISVFAQRNEIKFPNEPIEKIIVHTDRDLYLSGEKIWFKANCFVTDGAIDHHLSNVLYIELYNRSRDYIVKRKYSIEDGKAFGSIDIPVEFISGNYYLRAYTQYLKNYQPENFYTSILTIVDPRVPLPELKNEKQSKQIEILTGGGIIKEGEPSSIAIKLDQRLLSKIKDVILIDTDKTTVIDVNLNNDGFGLVKFTPEISTYYFIQAITNDNDTLIEQLPPSPPNGVFIKSSVVTNNNLRLKIINKNLPHEKDYILEIKSSNFKTFKESLIELDDESSELNYPLENLGNGTNFILIKDNKGEIICSHAFLKNKKEDSINLTITPDKEVYTPREKVTIAFDPGSLKADEFIDFSVSVVKKGTINYPDHIPYHFLNNPQVLLSYINGINFYQHFDQEEIDIFMLYFNNALRNSNFIKNILTKPTNEFLWIPEVRDVSISGVVYKKGGEVPAKNVPVYVSAFNENPQLHINKTNESGEFIFSLNKLVNNRDVFICAKSTRQNEFEIKVNNDFSHAFSRLNEAPFLINDSHTSLLEEMFINHQAGRSFKTETGKTEILTSHFPFSFDEPQITVRLDDYVSTPSLEMAIREFVPAVKLHQESDNYSLSIFNNRARTTYHYPLVLVDNIPIFNINSMLEIPPASIERIDVFKYPLILGDNFINGTFMITTNTNDFGGIEMPKGSIFLEYQTVSSSFAFDPQEYKSLGKKNNRIADFRNLLYWNPNLKIKNNNTVSFYTSDHCSDYDIIVKGITKKGKAFYKRASITVEK